MAVLLASMGPRSRASERCPLRLPVCKLSRRKHLASLPAAKAPGAAMSRRCERRGRGLRAVLCASSGSAALLHSKYDRQILSLAVPALFCIILVRLACTLFPPGRPEAAAEPGRVQTAQDPTMSLVDTGMRSTEEPCSYSAL